MCRNLMFIGLLISSLSPAFSTADPVIKETPGGGVNWSDGIVFAHGYGTAKPEMNSAQRRILSRRAAIVDGQRNLLEMTKGVRLTSATKVVDAMVKDSIIMTKVQGIIKGAVPIKENYQNDIYTVTLAMPMAGEFLKTVWQDDDDGVQQASLGGHDSWFGSQAQAVSNWRVRFDLFPSAYADDLLLIKNDEELKAIKRVIEWLSSTSNWTSAIENLEKSVIQFETNSLFSGLLIDASKVTAFELATVPKLRTQSGDIIYPSKQTSYDDIVNKRGVSYDFDLDDAIKNKRVATMPFVISAESTYKSLASDLVISDEDAERIRQSKSTSEAMNKAGVLIVVGV